MSSHTKIKNNKLFEKLADFQHQIWSDWMKYLFSKCISQNGESGDMLIPRDCVFDWKRQMNTAYKDLHESEKDSDREQVSRYWNLL